MRGLTGQAPSRIMRPERGCRRGGPLAVLRHSPPFRSSSHRRSGMTTGGSGPPAGRGAP